MTMQGAISGKDIVAALGGHWAGGQGRARCPMCNANAFTVQERKGGVVLVYCWQKCCPRDQLINGLRDRGLWRGRPDDEGKLSDEDKAELRRRREAREREEAEETEAREDFAAGIFRKALPPQGTPAEDYLRGRMIRIPIPKSIRFVPGLKHAPSGLVFPTLVAAMQAGDRRIVAVQRIFIDPETKGKALVVMPKMGLGPMHDGAVRLAKAGKALGLAEGIEDALSAMQIYSLPVWATLGASRLGSVTLPDSVYDVVIFADRGNGERQAEEAAEIYEQQGRRAQVVLPPVGFKDQNDVLRGVRMPEGKPA